VFATAEPGPFRVIGVAVDQRVEEPIEAARVHLSVAVDGRNEIRIAVERGEVARFDGAASAALLIVREHGHPTRLIGLGDSAVEPAPLGAPLRGLVRG